MFKKAAALLIAVSMAIPMWGVAAEESSNFEVISYQNFEDGANPFETTTSTTVDGELVPVTTINSTEYANNYAYGKTLYSVSPEGAYGTATMNLDNPVSNDPAVLGANAYVELSFDIKASNSSGNDRIVYIRMHGGGTKAFELAYCPKASSYFKYNGSSLISTTSSVRDVWVNVKTVVKLTDENSTWCGDISHIAIDGVEQLSGTEGFKLKTTDGTPVALEKISLSFQSSDSAWAYIDNFSLIKYNAENGINPAPDRFLFKKSIDGYISTYSEYIQEGNSTADLEGINNAVEASKLLYKKVALTNDDIKSANNTMANACLAFQSRLFSTSIAENFNHSADIPASLVSSAGKSYVDVNSFANMAEYKNAAVLSSIKGGTEYQAHTFSFSPITLGTTQNEYIEAEFDIKPFNITDSRTIIITLSGASKFASLKVQTNGRVDTYNDSTSQPLETGIGSFAMSDWNHVKIVLKNDANPAISKIFINGTEATFSDKSFFKTSTNFSKLTIKTNQNKASYDYEFGAYVDNLSVRRYSSENAATPYADMYGYRQSVAQRKAEYSALVQAGNAVAELDEIEFAIASAEMLYDRPLFDISQETLASALSAIDTAINTFKNIPYKTVLNESFNKSDSIPEGITSSYGKSYIETDMFANDITIKNALCLSSVKGGTEYPTHAVAFAPVSLPADEANTYIEAELDVMPFNLTDSRDIKILFRSSSTGKSGIIVGLRINASGKVDLFDDTSALMSAISVVDTNAWNHIKLVLQSTGADGSATNKIRKIIINGDEVVTDYDFFNNVSNLSMITIKTNQNKTSYDYEFGTYVDNLSIRKYISADGISPIADRYSLISNLRILSNEKERIVSNTENRGYTSEQIAALDAALSDLSTLFYKNYVSQSELEAASLTTQSIMAELSENAVKTLFNEQFEENENLFNAQTVNDGSFAVENAARLLDDTMSNNDFEPIFLCVNQNSALDAASVHGQDFMFEAEFDVMTQNGAQLSATLGSENAATVMFANSEIKLNYGDYEYRAGSLENSKWYRVRLVCDVTDQNGEIVSAIKELYVNGNNLTNTNRSFSKTASKIDCLTFASSGESYVDNVSIKTYYSGTTPPVNKGALVNYIRTGEKKLSTASIGTNVTENIYNSYQQAINTAEASYNNSLLQTDVDAATDELCSANSAFIFKNESVKIGTLEFTDADGQSSIFACEGGKISSLYVTRKADYTCGVIAVALYSADGLENICLIKNPTLPVGERTALDVNLQLPSNKEVSIKVMAFDGLSSLAPLSKTTVIKNDASIYIAGDSIVQTYTDTETKSYFPRQGWGKYIGDYFSGNVENKAVSGYTTVSYASNNKLNQVEATINEGDYLLVSFMANDRSKMTKAQYKNMLRYYNEVAQLHGATAVFITSPKIADTTPSFGELPQAMRDIAIELDVPLIDIYARREKFETEAGSIENVRSLMYLFDLEENFGLTEEQIQANLGVDVVNGIDKTHLSQWGAERIASWIATLCADADCGLKYQRKGTIYEEPKI